MQPNDSEIAPEIQSREITGDHISATMEVSRSFDKIEIAISELLGYSLIVQENEHMHAHLARDIRYISCETGTDARTQHIK